MLIAAASAGAPTLTPAAPLVHDFGLGDDKTISRRVEGVVAALVSAKLLIKSQLSDADASAVVSKSITTALTSAGQITNTGSPTGVGQIQFELAQSDTALLASAKYYYISVTDASGNAYTLERGVVSAQVPTPNPNARRKTANWSVSGTSLEPPSGGTRALPSELIDDLDQGEVYALTRKIGGTLPTGYGITNLVFTVRRAGTDPDGSAIVQKTVSVGAIGADLTYAVNVTFTAVDTAKFVGAMVWDAKLVVNNGTTTKKYTVATGTVNAQGALPPVGTVLPPVYAMAIATPATVTNIPLQLALTMTDASSNPINPATRTISWGSQNKSVALVSPTGLISAVAAGTADIVAICEGVEVRATVTVQAPVFSVTVTPNPLSVNVGAGASTLTTVLRDAANNVLTGRSIAYVSGNNSIATVDASGNVTAVANGSTTVTVTSEGILATVTVNSVALSALFKYVVGGSVPGTFTRGNAGYQFDTGGTISSIAINTPRDAHYFGTTRTLLLEPGATNRVVNSADMSQSPWSPQGSPTITTSADPFGTSLASTISDTSAGAFQYIVSLAVSIIADGNQTVSVLVSRGPSNPQYTLVGINDSSAGVFRTEVLINWTSAGIPVLTLPTAVNTVAYYVKQVGTGSLYWLVASFSSAVAANAHQLHFYPGYGATGTVSGQGDITIAHSQVENGLVATSPIVTGITQLTRAADVLTYTVPGGSGQNGTLYEKYIDLADGTLHDQVSAYTTLSTYAPQTGRAWIKWTFALGTQTLATMQSL